MTTCQYQLIKKFPTFYGTQAQLLYSQEPIASTTNLEQIFAKSTTVCI